VNVDQGERVASGVLGGTLVLLGLRRGTLAGAVAAIAGGGLLYRAATGHCSLYQAIGRNTAAGNEASEAGAPEDSAEVVRAITIHKSAEELERLWREPESLSRILGFFAAVSPAGDGRTHWKVQGPFGKAFEWETRDASDGTGKGLCWQSVEGAAIRTEGSLTFKPAPANRGTEATLHVRFDPPGGALGQSAAKLLGIVPRMIAEKALRRLKSLAETGEIPTTEHQPAARADTR